MPLYKDQIDEFNLEFKRWKNKIKFLTFGQRLSDEQRRKNFRLKVLILISILIGGSYSINVALRPRILESAGTKLISSICQISPDYLAGKITNKENKLQINQLEITGGPNAPFEYFNVRKLVASTLSFSLFNQTVEIEDIALSQIDAKINFPELNAEENDGIKKSYQMLQSTILKMPHIHSEKTNLTWGYSNYTKGALTDANITISKGVKSLTLKIHQGTLSQNFFKNLNIEKGTVILNEDQIIFQDFIIKDPFLNATLNGTVDINESLSTNFDINIKDWDLSYFHSQFGFDFIKGKVESNIQVTGNLNSQAGLKYTGTINTLPFQSFSLLKKNVIASKIILIAKLPFNDRLSFETASLNFEVEKNVCLFTEVDFSSKINKLTGEFGIYRPEDRFDKNVPMTKNFMSKVNIFSDLTFSISKGVPVIEDYQNKFTPDGNYKSLNINLNDNLNISSDTYAKEL